MSTKKMSIVRILFISLAVSFFYGVASTVMYSSFFEYKDGSFPSEIDLQTMTYEESEKWQKQNMITKKGLLALKVVFSDWFMFKHWLYSQWLIFIACFSSCLLTQRVIKSNGS